MSKNHLLEQVCKVAKLELELTIFNAKRALSKIDKKLELKKIGNYNEGLQSPFNIVYGHKIAKSYKYLNKRTNKYNNIKF